MNTYNKILENTYKLFLKKGLYNVSSEDISRASNISPGTLYYHFKNKDEIIENVLNKYVLKVYYDCLDEANNCNGDTFTRLTVFYKGILGLDNEYRPKYVFNNEDDFKKILVISFEGMQKYKAVYLAALGGAGAYISNSIKKCEIIAYDDLGAEAVRKLEVEDLQLIVAIDCEGNNIYDKREEYAKTTKATNE